MKTTDLTQAHIDKYVASTEEFWNESHKAMGAPHHAWDQDKDVNTLIGACINTKNLPSHLEQLLFINPVLKGEYILTFAQGMLLTNYRLLMNWDSCKYNIPLDTILTYGEKEIGEYKDEVDVVEFKVNGKTKIIEGYSISEGVVNNAINRNDAKNLDEVQKLILSNSFYDLQKGNDDLVIPKISWEDSVNYMEELKGNSQITTATNSGIANGGATIVLARDFIKKFKPLLDLLKQEDLKKSANTEQSSKIDVALNDLLSGNYKKANTLINEVLESNANIPAVWYVKAFIDALDSSKGEEYIDNINLSIESFENKYSNQIVIKKLKTAIQMVISYNYTSQISYYVANTISMEQQTADLEKVKFAAGIAAGVGAMNAMDKEKSNTSRALYGAGAAVAANKAVDAKREIDSLTALSSSTFSLAIAYSNLSVDSINRLKNQNIQDETLIDIFNTVFVNWKQGNLNLLSKIKSNLVDKLKGLKNNFYHPRNILKQKDFDYSDFVSFEVTLDLLGLDNHKIIKDNLMTNFSNGCKAIFTDSSAISEMKKYRNFSYILNTLFVLFLIPLFSFLDFHRTTALEGWLAVIGYIIFIWATIKFNHGSIHKTMKANCEGLLVSLEGANFDESDIELDKIGLD